MKTSKYLNTILQFRYVFIKIIDKQMLAIELLNNFIPEFCIKKDLIEGHCKDDGSKSHHRDLHNSGAVAPGIVKCR